MSDLTDHALIIAASAVTITSIVPPMLERTREGFRATTAARPRVYTSAKNWSTWTRSGARWTRNGGLKSRSTVSWTCASGTSELCKNGQRQRRSWDKTDKGQIRNVTRSE